MKTFAAAVVLAVMCGSAAAQDAESGLRSQLEQIAAAHHGKVAMYARQLNSGRTILMNADEPVQTASVIKLGMLYEAMEQVRAGKAKWDEKIVLQPGDAVNGSGILLFFDAPHTLTLKDVLTLMIIVSDNTATNLMIDRFGVGAVNARMEAIELKDTHFYKKVMKPATEPMPADQKKFGLGKTTAREIGVLMERIGRCELGAPGEKMKAGDAEICAVGMKMLRNQFYRETIPRYLEKLDASESGSGIASKTGSLDAVRADVAIVAGKTGPIVLSIFTYQNADHGWTVDNEGEVTIAKLAKAVVEAWSPAGIDGKTLVPGLGLDGAGAAAGASKIVR